MFFYIQLVCPNGSKMLPKSTQKPRSWYQNGHLGGHVGLYWRSWPPSWLQIPPIWAPRGFKMELGTCSFRYLTFVSRSFFPWPILVAICDQIGPNLGSSSPKFHKTASINTPRAHNIPPDRDFLISDPSKLNFHDFNKHSDQQGLHS